MANYVEPEIAVVGYTLQEGDKRAREVTHAQMRTKLILTYSHYYFQLRFRKTLALTKISLILV